MLIGPCVRFTGRSYKRHPLYASSRQNNNSIIDFWGPCSVMSLYSLVLWLGKVRDVTWLFVIWSLAAVFNHLVARVFTHSTLLLHVALLGYAVAPLIPLAALILLLRPPVWVSGLLQLLGVCWASSSALLSYSTIVSLPTDRRPRLRLLFPTVVLMTLYISSLIPTHR